MKTLAQRLVACNHFKWMPGMHAHAGRVLDVRELEICLADEGATEDGNTVRWVDSAGLEPYLPDPATLGCLLALVREVRGQPNAYARLRREPRSHQGLHWEVLVNAEEWRESILGTGGTEAEALVAALEAA